MKTPITIAIGTLFATALAATPAAAEISNPFEGVANEDPYIAIHDSFVSDDKSDTHDEDPAGEGVWR